MVRDASVQLVLHNHAHTASLQLCLHSIAACNLVDPVGADTVWIQQGGLADQVQLPLKLSMPRVDDTETLIVLLPSDQIPDHALSL